MAIYVIIRKTGHLPVKINGDAFFGVLLLYCFSPPKRANWVVSRLRQFAPGRSDHEKQSTQKYRFQQSFRDDRGVDIARHFASSFKRKISEKQEGACTEALFMKSQQH